MTLDENKHDERTFSGVIFADVLADVAEVFGESVSRDGLETLLSACMSVTDARSGRIHLDNGTNGIEMMVESQPAFAETSPRSSVPSRVMAHSLVSMRSEFDRDDPRGLVQSFPLRVRGRAIGAIELVSPTGHPFPHDLAGIAQSLADIAAVAIDRIRVIEQTSRLVSQLQNALENRVVLEQAKGVLAERLGTDCPAAFREIRNTARREQKPISEIAATILKGRNGGLQ